jgi:hypothetical protein
LQSSLLAISDTVGLQSALDLKDDLCFTNGTAPATPAAGVVKIFSKTSDKGMYLIDELGVETQMNGSANAAASWKFNTALSGDPGTGFWLTNNATPASVTLININATDNNSVSQLPLLSTLAFGDQIYTCDAASSNCKLYTVSSVVNNTTWFSITVTFESESNVANYSLNDVISISLFVNNNIFDQDLNTTDSPSFVNLTSTGEFQNPENTLQYSTGIMSGGVLSINADDTKFDITAGEGLIVDPDTQTFTHVTWAQQLAQDFSGAGYTGPFTAVYVDSSGVLQASTSLINNEQRRNRIHVGTLSHPNAVNIVSISNRKYPILNTLNQLHDLQELIGAVNVSGNVVSSNSLLTVAKSSGTIYQTGIGFGADIRNPNVGTIAASDTNVSDTFLIVYQDNSVRSATATSIIPGEYDDGNGQAAPGTVTSQNWSNMRVYVFNEGTIIITPGQVVYGTETDAQASIPTEDYTAPTNVATGLLIAFLTVRGGATDLSVLADAHILQATRFAGTGGGSAIQDFQGVYDNSSQPQITTSTALGAVQFKRGSALDSDPVFEVLDGSDNVNLEIEGDGTIICNHTSAEADTHTLEILHDAAGFADTKALDIVYTTGASTGEEEAILINIDKSGSSSGNINGMVVLATEGTATSDALLVGAGTAPLLHEVGAFADQSPGNIDNNGSTVAVGALSGVDLFVNDNDYVIVADAAQFEEIEFLLGVAASGSGIAPTFEFSTGTGPLAWTSFSPIDGTNGLRNSGIMAWTADDVPAWITDGGVYKIKITRTRNTLATVPQANNNGIKVAAIVEYGWDENADVTTNVMDANAYVENGVNSTTLREVGAVTNMVASSSHAFGTITSATQNTIIGNAAAPALTEGDQNTIIGSTNATLLTTADSNVIVGNNNMTACTTAGNNICIGSFTGGAIATGATYNVLIGGSANVSSDAITDAIGIGPSALCDVSRHMVLGNGSAPTSLTSVKPGLTAVTDLGLSTRQFKDLHLSGTVNCVDYSQVDSVPVMTLKDSSSLGSFAAHQILLTDSADATQASFITDTAGLNIASNAGDIVLKPGSSSDNVIVETTTGAFIPPPLTTTERNALTAIEGMIIANETTNCLDYYDGTAWVAATGAGSGVTTFSLTYGLGGSVANNAILDLANFSTAFSNTQGYRISGTGTTKLIGVNWTSGLSSATANATFGVYIETYPEDSGTAYTVAGGTAVHNSLRSSGGTLGAAYYRGYDDDGLDVTIGAGTSLFCYAQNAFHTVTDMTVNLILSYEP